MRRFIIFTLLAAVPLVFYACAQKDSRQYEKNADRILNEILAALYPDSAGDFESFIYTETRTEDGQASVAAYDSGGNPDFLPSESSIIAEVSFFTASDAIKDNSFVDFMKSIEYDKTVDLTDSVSARSGQNDTALMWSIGNWDFYFSGPSVYIETVRDLLPRIMENADFKGTAGALAFVGGSKLNVEFRRECSGHGCVISMDSDTFSRIIPAIFDITAD